jgi:MtrB/PioB family decaheme-associated outer membrane protein
MNENRKLKVMMAAILGAGVTAAPAVSAQELPDFEQWQCRFCPFPEKGLEGSAGASVLNVSDDSARFGDYTGLDDDGLYANADAELMYRADGGYAVSVDARNLGLDSRSIALRAGRQGSWVVDLNWDEIPRRLDDTGRTIYSGLGSSSLTLPSGWVRGDFTTEMTALEESLRDFTLGWDRETLGLGLEYVQSARLRYEVDWSYQTKQGRGLTWGNFIGTAEDLAKPLDYETNQVDAAVIYTGDNWHIRASYYGSFFSNKDTALTWENPFTGPDRGRSAMAPDNSYHQGQVSGAYRFAAWDSVLNASYAMGRMEQNDALLPYTINPMLPSLALPRESFDGEVDTTHANLRLTSRPTDRLRLMGEYRYSERDNKSGQYEWTPVQADSLVGVPFVNPAYGFEDTDFTALAEYRLSQMLQGTVGYRWKRRERDYQEVDRNEEDIYFARLRFRPISALALSGKVETSSRDASNYQAIPTIGPGTEQNPLLRKYYLADRDRDLVQVQADFTPAPRGSISLRYERAKDDYDESLVGLVSADYDQFSAEGNLQLWKSMVGTAYFSRDNYESRTVGAGSFATPNTAPPNWDGRSDDRHDVYGVALNWPGLMEGKLDLRADWMKADTTGDIRIQSPLGSPGAPFPSLSSKLTGAAVVADYHLNPRWTLNAGWRWEEYEADDWAIDGVGPATIPNVLTFGGRTQDYDVHVFMLGFRYNFIKEKAE